MKINFKFLLFIILVNPYSLAFAVDPEPKFWGSMEYLYWWVQSSPISIPLISENNNPHAFGFLNEPGTNVLFGAGSSRNTFDFGALSAARIAFGGWFDDARQYGIEASAFYLPSINQSFSASSEPSFPVVNVPFNSGDENVLVNKETPNRVLIKENFQSYGYEINALGAIPLNNFFSSVFIGYRYLNIKENFLLNDISFPSTDIVTVEDNFLTKNQFYGLQLGAKSNLTFGKLFLDISTSLALGNNYQVLKITGMTRFNQKILQDFGLFSEPTNLGTHTNNILAIIPELRIKLGLKLNQYIQPFFTYNGFYMNHVLRPGNALDRNINTSQNSLIGGTGTLNGAPAPKPQFHNASMWMQGLSAGINFSW